MVQFNVESRPKTSGEGDGGTERDNLQRLLLFVLRRAMSVSAISSSVELDLFSGMYGSSSPSLMRFHAKSRGMTSCGC